LFVGIGPVVDLLLDEFAGGNSPERCAGQIKIAICGDRHDVSDFFIAVFQKFGALSHTKRDLFCVLRLKQLFCVLPPRAVMILIQNHAIPVGGVNPFVLGFDAARAGVAAQVILKRPETDDWFFLVGLFISQAAGLDKLPPCKIHVTSQVFFPCVLHRWLECQHQHFPPAHLFGQLIGSEGFPEPHLAVPEEMRRFVHVVFIFVPIGEIRCRRFDRGFLFGPHPEVQGPALFIQLTGTQGDDCRLDLRNCALEPFSAAVPDTIDPQHLVDIVIGERRSVITHGGLFQNDPVRRLAGFFHRILLGNTAFHIYSRVTDLE